MRNILNRTRNIIAFVLVSTIILSLNNMPAYAAEIEADQPIIIGQYDGWLSDCVENEDIIMRASVVNVRVNSYATYSAKKGINVVVKLYAPAGGTQPKFTGMTGSVTINMNKKNTVKSFAKVAVQTKTIKSTVKTGVKGKSGEKGTVAVSGAATATNALFGGGAFAISYGVVIP